MQIQITGRNVEITPALRSFVEQKISKLSHHFDHIGQTHVILSIDRQRQIAEAKMNVSGGEIFAQSEEKDLYAAIDLLHDKLDRQIIKHKEKLKSHL